ncbi:MAG: amidohydrolase family protein, partial [Firmicutes bacterium]|nr:amidohydrolase family protein [Bacillota bacterium]
AVLPKEELLDVMNFLGEYESRRDAYIAGINLEGPFISPVKTGALDARNVLTFDRKLFGEFQKAAKGKIKLLDLAPECMPDMDDISKLAEDVHISLAHTDCDYGTAKRAFSLGADHLTHAFNAMNGIGHRQPGPVMAAAEAGAFAEIIADGVHIHPSVVKLALKIFGEDRTVFVSDSMMAAGMPDGEYSLGGKDVSVSGGKAVLKEDPSVIAGSAVDLLECVKRAVAMGIPLETAIRCASENPARSIGIEKDFGTLSPGSYANVLLLDEDLEIRAVINRGFMIGENRI